MRSKMFSKILVTVGETMTKSELSEMASQNLLWSALVGSSTHGKINEITFHENTKQLSFVIASSRIPFSFMQLLNKTIFPDSLIEIYTNSKRKLGYAQWQSDFTKFSWFADKTENFICDILLREFVNFSEMDKFFPEVIIPRRYGLGNAITVSNWKDTVNLSKIKASKIHAQQFAQQYYIEQPSKNDWYIIPNDPCPEMFH